MEIVDCLGENCPIPILKLKNHLKAINEGSEIMIVTDHSCAYSNIKDFCNARNLCFKSEEVMNGIWELRISK